MKNILLYIWQLPQNLFALVILFINRKNMMHSKVCKVIFVKHLANAGISLGNYIIIDIDRPMYERDVKHEMGHKKQSLYLGWAYLPIIGFPSLCGNIIDRFFHKTHRKNCWYYRQPWEAWADKLGGVNR